MPPPWARWHPGAEARFTVGVEEELMLLDRADWTLAQRSDQVWERLSPALAVCVAPETHAAVVELVSSIHLDVASAVAEVVELRNRLASQLKTLGLSAACAGMYPLAREGRVVISGSGRYQRLSESLRELVHREPTMALHVHVGIPDPHDAVRVLNALREATPVLLALSGNSPYTQSRDCGFASLRTVTFQSFPRTGPPPPFADYDDYVATIDPLIASTAIPDPSFLWWDVRLQPALGTVETRVMDAQTLARDTGALVALVQCLARRALEQPTEAAPLAREVLAENRFLAARDGMRACVIDPRSRGLIPIRKLAEELLAECRPHAEALACEAQLADVSRLLVMNGSERQRLCAAEFGLDGLVPRLAHSFTHDQGLQSRLGTDAPVPAA